MSGDSNPTISHNEFSKFQWLDGFVAVSPKITKINFKQRSHDGSGTPIQFDENFSVQGDRSNGLLTHRSLSFWIHHVWRGSAMSSPMKAQRTEPPTLKFPNQTWKITSTIQNRQEFKSKTENLELISLNPKAKLVTDSGKRSLPYSELRSFVNFVKNFERFTFLFWNFPACSVWEPSVKQIKRLFSHIKTETAQKLKTELDSATAESIESLRHKLTNSSSHFYENHFGISNVRGRFGYSCLLSLCVSWARQIPFTELVLESSRWAHHVKSFSLPQRSFKLTNGPSTRIFVSHGTFSIVTLNFMISDHSDCVLLWLTFSPEIAVRLKVLFADQEETRWVKPGSKPGRIGSRTGLELSEGRWCSLRAGSSRRRRIQRNFNSQTVSDRNSLEFGSHRQQNAWDRCGRVGDFLLWSENWSPLLTHDLGKPPKPLKMYEENKPFHFLVAPTSLPEGMVLDVVSYSTFSSSLAYFMINFIKLVGIEDNFDTFTFLKSWAQGDYKIRVNKETFGLSKEDRQSLYTKYDSSWDFYWNNNSTRSNNRLDVLEKSERGNGSEQWTLWKWPRKIR